MQLLWSFVGGAPIQNRWREAGRGPCRDRCVAAPCRRGSARLGFAFVGSHHLLCVHAVGRARERPRGRLLPPRAVRESRSPPEAGTRRAGACANPCRGRDERSRADQPRQPGAVRRPLRGRPVACRCGSRRDRPGRHRPPVRLDRRPSSSAAPIAWLGLSRGMGRGSCLLLLLLNVAPFAMIRLVDDFSGTAAMGQVGRCHRPSLRSRVLGLAAFGARPAPVEIATIVWFLAVGGYAAIAFAREAGRRRGHHAAAHDRGRGRRGALHRGHRGRSSRTRCCADGATVGLIIQLAALAAVLAFFLGFAPPAWIRRGVARARPARASSSDPSTSSAWRTIARPWRSSSRPRRTRSAHREPRSASRTRSGRILRYVDAGDVGGVPERRVHRRTRVHRAATDDRGIDAATDDPENAGVYDAAPGRARSSPRRSRLEDRRIGVLTVYAERAPIFVEDDLWLLELLADQTAVLLEARALTLADEAICGRGRTPPASRRSSSPPPRTTCARRSPSCSARPS